MSSNRLLLSAGFCGLLGVALGAFGAHALHDILAQHQTTALWQTAVFYQLIHAVALLGVAGWAVGTPMIPPAGVSSSHLSPAAGSRHLRAAAVCWIGGIILFSGSLYALALGAPRGLGWITPIGGLLLLAGWALVAIQGWRATRNR